MNLSAKIFFLLFALTIVFYSVKQNIEVRAAVPGMLMVFSTTSPTVNPNRLFYTVWSGTSWGTVGSASLGTPNITDVVVKCARFIEECLAVTLDGSGYIAGQKWDGSTWSATTTLERLTTAGDSIYRPYDFEYEKGTDRGILVTRGGNNADPVYRIWSNGSWSATSTIDIPTTGAPRYIELASQNFSTSTRIAMIVLDANSDVYGMEWDGSSWSNMGISTAWEVSAGSATKKAVDVTYESASGAAIFAWANIAAANDIYYKRWNGASFSASTSLDITTMGGAGEWLSLSGNAYSATNTILLGVQDAAADINSAEWTGSVWNIHGESEASAEAIAYKNFGIGYDNATTSGLGYIAYGEGAVLAWRKIKHGVLGAATDPGSTDDTNLVVIGSSYQNRGVQIVGYESDGSASDDIMESHSVNGSELFTTKATIWGGLTNAAAYFRVDVTPSRFFTYPTYNQAAFRWFNNADDTTAGTTLTSAQDEAATTTRDGQNFRLRMLLDVTTATSTAPEHDTVLQFATKSGACDTSFTGESYATVTPTTNIAFYNNGSVVDAATASVNGSDPTYSGHTIVYQTYEETNAATTTSDIAPGKAGLVDFALNDNNGASVTAYCFRLVKGSGAPLTTYTVVPELTTYVDPTISAAYDQIFDYHGAASSTATLTVTDVGGGIITGANDLRVFIATTTLASTTIDMRWDTSDTYAIFGGTASTTKVSSAVVSYEGNGTVLVVPVASDFSAGETLTISGVSFKDFNTATSSKPGVIGLFTAGTGDQTIRATTTQSVAIRGTLTLSNHEQGQLSDQWDTQTPTTTVHFRYALPPMGESISLGTTTFALSSITGISTSDITSAKLYIDYDGDGIINNYDQVASDTAGSLLYDGLVEISGGSGTIKFATSTRYNLPIWHQMGGDYVRNSWDNSTYEEIASLASFNDKVYAGLGVTAGDAEVWEYASTTWGGVKIGGDGVNSSWADSTYETVLAMTSSSSSLYVGLGTGAGDAEVWAYNNSTWTQVGGDSINSSWTGSSDVTVQSLLVYSGKLYAVVATTVNLQVWSYNGSTWTQIGGDSINASWITGEYNTNVGIRGVYPMATYGSNLLLGMGVGTGDSDVWSWNGTGWTQVGGDGINSSWSDTTYKITTGMISFDGKLYVGIGSGTAGGSPWAQAWAYNGSSWVQVGGFGLTNGSWTESANRVTSFASYDNYLYAGTGRSTAGVNAHVWRYSTSSASWAMVGGAIDDSWSSTVSDITLVTHNDRLYAGLMYSLGSGGTADLWEYGGYRAFLLRLTASNLASGDTMTVALTTPNILVAIGTTSAQSIVPTGSASSVTHTFDTPAGNSNPTLSVNFNNGNTITLNEGTYKFATATLTIDDTDGCSTINNISATAFLASTSAPSSTPMIANDASKYITGSSTPNNASCVATTTLAGGSCTGGGDTSVTYDCGFKLWYIAAATDATAPVWATSIWAVSATTSDGSATTTATNTAQTIEINSLAAASVTSSIDYGTITPGSDSGSTNATTTATTTGNIWIDVNLSGVDMTSGSNTLLVGQQCYASSPFVWATSCTGSTALTTSAVRQVLSGGIPSSTTSPPASAVSWGIGVPGGQVSGTYSGTNNIDAVAH